MSQHVKWVLDADRRSFFDSVDHEWLLRGGAQDRRSSHLAAHGLFLRAGVLESGEKQETDRGTPQAAGISPLLANISCTKSPISGPRNGVIATHAVLS